MGRGSHRAVFILFHPSLRDLLVQFAHSLLHFDELDLPLKAPFEQLRQFGLRVF